MTEQGNSARDTQRRRCRILYIDGFPFLLPNGG